MEQKIFMVLQVSKPKTESRKYADGIFGCIEYGLRGLKNFVEKSAYLYGDERADYETCRDEIRKMNINLENTYKLERHDLNAESRDLLQELIEKLSEEYFGYIVLVDTDKEFNNHDEPPYTNANVFFEYGVLCAKSKRIALLKQENTKLPWDIGTDNATIIPEEILELVKKEIENGDDLNTITSIISDTNKSTQIIIYKMVSKILHKLNTPIINENTFSSVFDRMELKRAGFENTRQTLEKLTALLDTLDAKKILEGSIATYLDTEEKAFKALTDAVSRAKKSIRTTRFANQSIVMKPREKGQICHQEFMEALYKATIKNPNLLCYRIVCNNHSDKWWDIYQTLKNSNNNMKIFVCKQQYDIHFEIVVIDREITFLHFYQTSEDGHKDGNKQSDDVKVRKIQSTLRITNEAVSREFAKVFDRLHHRDQDSMSRRLLQVGGNAENIEDEFEGMMLKLDEGKNPDMEAQKLLLNKWKAYKEVYDKQSKSSPNNMDKQDYIYFTKGLAQENDNGCKGCGIQYDEELMKAYNKIRDEENSKTSKEI